MPKRARYFLPIRSHSLIFTLLGGSGFCPRKPPKHQCWAVVLGKLLERLGPEAATVPQATTVPRCRRSWQLRTRPQPPLSRRPACPTPVDIPGEMASREITDECTYPSFLDYTQAVQGPLLAGIREMGPTPGHSSSWEPGLIHEAPLPRCVEQAQGKAPGGAAGADHLRPSDESHARV